MQPRFGPGWQVQGDAEACLEAKASRYRVAIARKGMAGQGDCERKGLRGMSPSPDTMHAAKEVAAEHAVMLVEDGMALGLGSGSTAEIFLDLLSRRVQDTPMVLKCVATSRRTHDLAQSLGLDLHDLNALERLDLVIDGADEFTADCTLLKGGGGAHLHEKLCARAAERMVAIADISKLVTTLGAFALPVEILKTGWRATVAMLEAGLSDLGYTELHCVLREDGEFITDEGNLIVDIHLGQIPDPGMVEAVIDSTIGVVTSGLFTSLCQSVICGYAGGRVRIFTAAGGETEVAADPIRMSSAVS